MRVTGDTGVSKEQYKTYSSVPTSATVDEYPPALELLPLSPFA
jgi:hypothetical protein